MIKQGSLDFLRELKNNNSKDWFEANREWYEEYRGEIHSLAESLLQYLAEFDPSISAANLDPKKSLTRVNRDLRFSKDKTPYKNYVLIVFNKNGFHGNTAGYYLQIEPGNSFVGGGIWQTSGELLKKIRQEVDYSYQEINGIISDKQFQNTFPNGLQGVGKLKKVPVEYEEANPANELLKMKGYCTKEKLGDEVLTGKNCLQTILTHFKTSKPLIDYLNKAIESRE
jgi:uncharacterized protein (TIGR02453 family)